MGRTQRLIFRRAIRSLLRFLILVFPWSGNWRYFQALLFSLYRFMVSKRRKSLIFTISRFHFKLSFKEISIEFTRFYACQTSNGILLSLRSQITDIVLHMLRIFLWISMLIELVDKALLKVLLLCQSGLLIYWGRSSLSLWSDPFSTIVQICSFWVDRLSICRRLFRYRMIFASH